MVSRNGLNAGIALGSALAVACVFTQPAAAQEATAQAPPTSVNFNDPSVGLSVRSTDGSRFSATDPTDTAGAGAHDQLELQLSASGAGAGLPLDVAVAHRDSLAAQDTGRDRRGSELRIGQNLVQHRDPSHARGSSVYAFVSSDDEALTWRPGGHPGGSLAMQDQVEVGDRAAGVTYEHNGVQTSLAYVEREVHTRVGANTYSTDENFAGVTVTLRR
jgi:hypothetical protein